ncbi:MAG: 30S ribosomal protein S20 [Gammaproteobacteria bacterium]
MANSPSALKRARQNIQRRLLRSSQRAEVRTAIKKVRTAVSQGDYTNAKNAYQAMTSLIDRKSGKGCIKKRHADRQKSRLNALVRSISP